MSIMAAVQHGTRRIRFVHPPAREYITNRIRPSCESAAKANRIRITSHWWGKDESDSPNLLLAWRRRIGEAAQRIAHQPPQAHGKACQKPNDLVRAAVGCMGGLDGEWW